MQEIKRVENWEEGEVNCVVCGKTLRLWYNGGELDMTQCCGHMYKTEHVRTDLVICKMEPRPIE